MADPGNLFEIRRDQEDGKPVVERPLQERIDFGRTVFKRAFARVIIPSGSNSILPDYLAQITP